MKVGELIKYLEQFDDDVEVVSGGFDHTYYGVRATISWGVPNGRNRFDEAESLDEDNAQIVVMIE